MANNNQWKSRVQDMFSVCQGEFKKTAEIGKKMLSASKANTALNESYEELGMLVAQAIKEESLDWDHPRVKEIMKLIDNCEQDLETIESEVNDIRFSNQEDIQKGS